MQERISETSTSLWQTLSLHSTDNDDQISAAEQGQLPPHQPTSEKTPLLNPTKPSPRRLYHLLSQILSATLLAPVYSVLVFLPMLPFWTFAGFLVYLLGTSGNGNFYLYCGCLTVLLPFNVVGTAAIVRTVWVDLYGE